MKFTSLFFGLVLLMVPGAVRPAEVSSDAAFEQLAGRYVEDYLVRHPEQATSLGDHRFDNRLDDYSAAGRKRELADARKTLKELGRISPERLNRQNAADFAILGDHLEAAILEMGTIRSFEWNPMAYNAANSIYLLLAREYAPLPDRLRAVEGRLRGISNVVAAARANLRNPPRLHTETAIQQNQGSIHLVGEELNAFIVQASPGMRSNLVAAQSGAVQALREYGRWLEKDLLPRSKGDFRYGDKKFRARLRYSLGSALSKEEILRNAEADLAKTQGEMYETARELHRKFFPAATAEASDPAARKQIIKHVLDQLAERHPADATIVEQARRDLQECAQFVQERKIVSIPAEPLQVIVMPEFQRGVAVAYCDAPGALARNEATFFAIAPTPSDWTPRRKESFYREYNDYMLKNLTVHEAMPGHYLQLIHANGFQAPTKIRALFPSGIFAEGWATYTEQVMASMGFGGPEVKMQQLKMRLRLIINAIIDQKIHTAGMTEKEAMALMMEEGFQEEGEAAGKWKRACLTATQLSTYFVGNLEVNALAEARKGSHPGESMMDRHDKIISFGSVAPKYLRALIE